MSNKQDDDDEGLSSTLVCVKCDSRIKHRYLIFFGEDFNLQNLALKSGYLRLANACITCLCLHLILDFSLKLYPVKS
jgi:hypothetical protein